MRYELFQRSIDNRPNVSPLSFPQIDEEYEIKDKREMGLAEKGKKTPKTHFGSFSTSTLNPKSNIPAQSPFSTRKLQLGVSIISPSLAAGVNAIRGADIEVVGMIDSLTISFEDDEWGSGVNG